MSSSESGFSQLSNSTSSSSQQSDTCSGNQSPEHNVSAEREMDQHSHPSTDMVSSASSSTSESASSPLSPSQSEVPQPSEASKASTITGEAASVASSDIPRQQPIPPASEPMQYRAIGLVHGKYIASEEQFTRGQMITDEGLTLDAVLLGRVMSLVKKHLDLEQSHLWVVYPRTRNNDDQLHVQIVGVWEPENLNKDSAQSLGTTDDSDDSGADESSADESSADGALAQLVSAEARKTDTLNNLEGLDPEHEESEASESNAVEGDAADSVLASASTPSSELPDTNGPIVEAPQPAAGLSAIPPRTSETDKAITAASQSLLASPPEKPVNPPLGQVTPFQPILEDGYFSIRGEVIKQSKEDNLIKIKIRQAPRRDTEQMKTFNLTLQGLLDDKAVGYFWDLHVQRQGNDLVVEDATLIGLVPPTKRSKSGGRRPYSGAGGGRGRFNKGGKPSRPPFKRGGRGVAARDPESQGSSGSASSGRPISRPVKRRQQSDSQSTPE